MSAKTWSEGAKMKKNLLLTLTLHTMVKPAYKANTPTACSFDVNGKFNSNKERQMNEEITHLVINWINIEDNVILVGATDNLRWKWDTEEGMSGVDAKTIVYVTLTDNGKGIAVSEEAGFHCAQGDPTRLIAMSNLFQLFEIAWVVKNENLDLDKARKRFFGKIINNTLYGV